jgi:NAD(P)-dependent dehydrogenase (short-subunit alcohol dehydrogenase family)
MQRGVLVTGASSGIGYACAALLAQHGFVVFAGVRGERDAERVGALHAEVRPLLLDVTVSEQVAAAAQAIRASGVPLRAAVNNAGIAVAGPLEFLPLDEIRRQFEVNLFGALAVTQAVLPMLRESRGRVVFMSSVSGQIAPPLLGAYAASKFALEAVADAMRMELSKFGIATSVVQPGNVRTPIWEKGRKEKDLLAERMPPAALRYYGKAIDALLRATLREERNGIDAAVVAQAVLRAVTDETPRARYPVGSPPAWQRRMAALLPERWRDRLVMRAFD